MNEPDPDLAMPVAIGLFVVAALVCLATGHKLPAVPLSATAVFFSICWIAL